MAAKYDKIGIHYNRTRCADPYITSRLLHHLKPVSAGRYLDMGCGTGNYTDALQKKGHSWVGVDPSEEMLSKARIKNRHIAWQMGTAEKPGLKENSIDGAIGSLTLHHWKDINKGFAALYQVLKPHSNLVIFTSSPIQMKGYWLRHYFPKMLKESIQQMPDLDRVTHAMNQAGFLITEIEKYNVKPDLQDLFLYSGKHRPKLYFIPEVRQGISSFSALSNACEVAEGLSKMKYDIARGKIDEVIASYENPHGDYLFIAGKVSHK